MTVCKAKAVIFTKKIVASRKDLPRHGATVLIGLMKKSHKIKGFEQSINSINLQNK